MSVSSRNDMCPPGWESACNVTIFLGQLIDSLNLTSEEADKGLPLSKFTLFSFDVV